MEYDSFSDSSTSSGTFSSSSSSSESESESSVSTTESELEELETALEENDIPRLKLALKNIKDDNGKQTIVSEGDMVDLLNIAAAGVEACRVIYNHILEQNPARTSFSDAYHTRTPLHEAAKAGNTEKVEFFLVECNFKVNEIINDSSHYRGQTPLICAAGARPARNATATCRLLLCHGADPNKGESPLQLAAIHNNTELALLLLEHKATPDEFCVDSAVRNGNDTILSALLRHGARWGLENQSQLIFGGQTALNILLQANDHARQTKVNICRILVNHARDHDEAKRCIERTLYAMSQGHQRAHFDILFEAGMVDRFTSCMFYAVLAKNISVCRWLVQVHGANPLIQGHHDHGRSPFRQSACIENTAVLALFVSFWTDWFPDTPHVNPKNGNNPFHEMCCQNKDVSLPAVQAVMQAVPKFASSSTAALSARNHQGYVPFELAAEADASLDVIFYLLKNGGSGALKPRPSKDALEAQIASLQQDKKILQTKVDTLEAENEALRAAFAAKENPSSSSTAAAPANKKAKTNHHR